MCIGTDCQKKSTFLFTNVDVIYYSLQNFAWIHQTLINLIPVLPRVLMLIKSRDSVRFLSRWLFTSQISDRAHKRWRHQHLNAYLYKYVNHYKDNFLYIHFLLRYNIFIKAIWENIYVITGQIPDRIRISGMCAIWPWPWSYGFGSRSWHTLDSWIIIARNIIEIQHVSEDLWSGYGFRVCVHCDLDLGDMTLGQGHDTHLSYG